MTIPDEKNGMIASRATKNRLEAKRIEKNRYGKGNDNGGVIYYLPLLAAIGFREERAKMHEKSER